MRMLFYLDSEDGPPNIIAVIGKQVLKLLKGDIDSLKIPTFLKKALHKLKSIFFLIDDKKEPKEGNTKMVARIVADQRR